jgi:ribonuclease J
MEKVRILTLGGLDEDGRNMSIVEIDDDIIVIDAGLKYPDNSLLGVESIIPNFSYLTERIDRVLGIIITHGHDDVMGALPYFIKECNVPIYAAPFTALVIEDILRKHQISDYKLHRIKRAGNHSIGRHKIRTFSLTHSICDTMGIAIQTQHGYIVHASEYIIDFDLNIPAFDCDITEFAEIGKKGVFALMTESRSSERVGFTSPRHRIKSALEPIIENSQNRVVITLYQQNLYRLIEVFELAVKYRKKIVFASENHRSYINYLKKLKYYNVPDDLEIRPNRFDNNREDVIVIVADQGPTVFRLMHTIATGDHSFIQLRQSDTIVIASPIVPGSEKDASRMEDELFKDGVQVETLSREEFLTMHPSSEDLKMMLTLFKPKYYVPLKGEYRHLIENANLALNRGYYAGNIVVLDNGQVAYFEDGELKAQSEFIETEEVFIDGSESLDSTGLVLKDREILATDGTLIVGMVINHQTKEILGGPDVQSRGVIYLKDADYVVKECGNILERVINEAVEQNRYDNVSARNEAREHMSKYVLKMTGKRPMILPVIIEINV